MNFRSLVLVTLLAWTPGALLAQQRPQLSKRDSVVTLTLWRKACTVATAAELTKSLTRQRDAQIDAPLKARTQAELNRATTRRDTLRFALTPEVSASIEWLCLFQDSRVKLEPAARIPTRAEVFRAAVITDSMIPLLHESLSPAGVIPSFLGISEAKLVSGLTTLIMDRAAAEIQIALVERMEEAVCGTQALLRVVSTASCTVLTQDHLKLRKSVLQELHTAVRTDLRNLPRTVPLTLVNGSGFKKGELKPDQQDLILATYVIGTAVTGILDGLDPLGGLSATLTSDPGVLDSSDPRGVLESVLARADDKKISLPAAAVLHRLALAGLVLPDDDGDGVGNWPREDGVRLEVMRALVVNANAWLVELGLTRAGQADRVIRDVVATVNAIRDSHKKLEALQRPRANAASGDAVLAEYAGFVSGALEVAEIWAGLMDGHRTDSVKIRPVIAELRKAISALAAKDYSSATIAFYTVASTFKNRDLTPPKDAVAFFSLAASLAEAKSGDEVASVLKASAAPVQSYRGKRNAQGLYIALNGYLGAGGGWESANDNGGAFLGVSAPIGIEVGVSLGKGWSLGLLGQVLDLGALASFRMNASDDQLESEPEVGFAQIFSPGASVVLGFPGAPVGLGLGYNVAPSLRKLSANPEETKTANRVAVFLSVDMPLLRVK